MGIGCSGAMPTLLAPLVKQVRCAAPSPDRKRKLPFRGNCASNPSIGRSTGACRSTGHWPPLEAMAFAPMQASTDRSSAKRGRSSCSVGWLNWVGLRRSTSQADRAEAVTGIQRPASGHSAVRTLDPLEPSTVELRPIALTYRAATQLVRE